MQVLTLGRAEIRRLLPMGACVDVMADALRALARGNAAVPLRSSVKVPGLDAQHGGGSLLTMPCYLGEPPAIALKVLTVFPGNAGTELETHQGAVVLFDAGDGRLQAILDASAITAIRTAGVSAVATRELGRPDAGDLALLGSGVQAREHLEAMSVVRPIERVRVWSRNPEHVRAFVEREASARPFPVLAAPTAEAAVRDAGIICTVTSATEPVLRGEWISAGAHINAVGAFSATSRELDTQAVLRSRLFVDRRDSALSEAGDFLIPRSEGAVDDGHIQGELGDLLLGRVTGRRSATEITLFKALGLAVEDAAAAHHVYRQALEHGTGIRIEL